MIFFFLCLVVMYVVTLCLSSVFSYDTKLPSVMNSDPKTKSPGSTISPANTIDPLSVYDTVAIDGVRDLNMSVHIIFVDDILTDNFQGQLTDYQEQTGYYTVPDLIIFPRGTYNGHTSERLLQSKIVLQMFTSARHISHNINYYNIRKDHGEFYAHGKIGFTAVYAKSVRSHNSFHNLTQGGKNVFSVVVDSEKYALQHLFIPDYTNINEAGVNSLEPLPLRVSILSLTYMNHNEKQLRNSLRNSVTPNEKCIKVSFASGKDVYVFHTSGYEAKVNHTYKAFSSVKIYPVKWAEAVRLDN